MYLLLLLLHFLFTFVLGLFYKKNIDGETKTKISFVFVLLVVCYILLIVYKPIELIPDAKAYYYRYNNNVSLFKMKNIDIFQRNNLYNMNFLSSWLFFCFKNFGVSYNLFVLIVVTSEVVLFFHYAIKICDEMHAEINIYFLFLVYMIFYGYAYQFIAFSEGISIIIGLIATYYTIKKNYPLALVFILISFFVHSSGFANLIVCLIIIYSKQYKKRNYLIIWGILTVLIISGLSSIFSNFSISVISELSDRLQGSFSYYEKNYSNAIPLRNVVYCFQLLILIITNCNSKLFYKLLNISVMALIIMCLFSVNPASHRIYDIFIFYSLFPLLISYKESMNESTGKRSITNYSLLLVLLFQFISRLTVLNLR